MNERVLLTKEQILAADDMTTETVDVPEWGGSVVVRTLTGTERDQLEASVVGDGDRRDLVGLRAKYAALSIVDIDGKRVFTFEDVEALGRKSATALDRVFEVCLRLSRMSRGDMEKLRGN